MAADGTPEPAAQRCGAAVARLRTLRNLSRSQLVARLCDELAASDPTYERISTAWLARLENGRSVKIARPIIEALCRALCCTPRERAWLLLCADRNVLSGGDDRPTAAAELLTYAIDQLHRDAAEQAAALLGSRQACALSELELLELTAAALALALAERRAWSAAQQSQKLSEKNGVERLRPSKPPEDADRVISNLA